VVFHGGNQNLLRNIKIWRSYSETPHPGAGWNTATHPGGITLHWKGNFGGWGGATYKEILLESASVYVDLLADCGRTNHSIGYYFMLRGGGAIYHIASDQNTQPQIYYSSSELTYNHPTNNIYDVYARAPITTVNTSKLKQIRVGSADYAGLGNVEDGADITNYNDTRVSNDNISGSQVDTAAGWAIRPVSGANLVTNTTDLTDGAGLGLNANWNNLAGNIPSAVDNSSITGSQIDSAAGWGVRPTSGADATDYSDTRVANNRLENSRVHIPFPIGGNYSVTASSVAGAIKINLPKSWTATMMKFTIDVYNYVNNTSFTCEVGGYNTTSSGGYWTQTTAHVYGTGDTDHTVRFGHDGSKCCILIGDVTDTWSYPKISVRNFYAGHSGASIANWDDGWSINFVTTLPSNIDVTITDALLGSSWNNSANRPLELTDGRVAGTILASRQLAATTAVDQGDGHSRPASYGVESFTVSDGDSVMFSSTWDTLPVVRFTGGLTQSTDLKCFIRCL